MSPGRLEYMQTVQNLQIVGSKKNTIPLIKKKMAKFKAEKKNKKYFGEKVPSQNEDIKSYTNMEQSQNAAAKIKQNLDHSLASMLVELSDQSNIYNEIHFPVLNHHSMSALSDYRGEDYLPVPIDERVKVITQPYMYSTVNIEPSPTRIAEIEHSEDTESSGTAAIALKPKPITKSPFQQTAKHPAKNLEDDEHDRNSMNIEGSKIINFGNIRNFSPWYQQKYGILIFVAIIKEVQLRK